MTASAFMLGSMCPGLMAHRRTGGLTLVTSCAGAVSVLLGGMKTFRPALTALVLFAGLQGSLRAEEEGVILAVENDPFPAGIVIEETTTMAMDKGVMKLLSMSRKWGARFPCRKRKSQRARGWLMTSSGTQW